MKNRNFKLLSLAMVSAMVVGVVSPISARAEEEAGGTADGWREEEDGNWYYFDPTYGTMAKGTAVIDETICEFDQNSGVLIAQKEFASASSYNVHKQDYTTYFASIVNSYLCEGEDGSFYRVEYITG